MAEPPFGSSTEVRGLRDDFVKAAAMTALFGGLWIAVEWWHGRPATRFLAGYWTVAALLKAGRSARAWWLVRGDQAARFASRPAYATVTIALALVVVGWIEFVVVGSASRAIAVAGLDRAKVAAGEWWRVLTSSFLHVNGAHLWGNFAALISLGRLVEAYSSRSRFLLAYLAAVVSGSLASCWLLPHATSVGASGGILGLAGFLYALSLRRPDAVPAVYRTAAMATMILTALVGAVGYWFIDNAAHAGGALAGFLVGWLTVPQELPQIERSRARYTDDRVVSMTGAAAGVVLAAAAAVTGAKVYAKQPQPVTSVLASISPRYSGGFNVTLENLKNVPLQAYTLEVYDSGLRAVAR